MPSKCDRCKGTLKAYKEPTAVKVGAEIFEGALDGWRCLRCRKVTLKKGERQDFINKVEAHRAEHALKTAS